MPELTPTGRSLLKKKTNFEFRSGVRGPARAEAFFEEESTETAPEAAPDFEKIYGEYEKKNAFHRDTDALGRFVHEGGNELVAMFGAEKVAHALDELLKGPVDERTGLYMLIRKLEPSYKKRQEVYARMERLVDVQAQKYQEEYAALTSEQAKNEFRVSRGGDYAPIGNSSQARRVRIHEYRMFDRGAFSPVGAVWNAAVWATMGGPGKGYAVTDLQGRFKPEKFIEGLKKEGGDVGKYLAARLAAEAQMEGQLEEWRVARRDELEARVYEAREEIEAPFLEHLRALQEDEARYFGARPLKQVESEEARKAVEEMQRAMIDDGAELVKEMEEAVTKKLREEFATEFALVDKIRQKEKKDEALRSLCRLHADRISALEAPFQERIERLSKDFDRLFGDEEEEAPRSPVSAEIIKQAREMFTKRAQDIKDEMYAAVRMKLGAIVEEVQSLFDLDVYNDYPKPRSAKK